MIDCIEINMDVSKWKNKGETLEKWGIQKEKLEKWEIKNEKATDYFK